MLHLPLSATGPDGPYGYYRELREKAPAFWSQRQQAWVVAGFDDALDLLTRPALFSSHIQSGLDASLAGADPPRHTRVRNILAAAFSADAVAAFEDWLAATARDLLAKAMAAGSFDVIADFARPLPRLMLARMLGIPECRMVDFARWSEAAMSLFAPGSGPDAATNGKALHQMLVVCRDELFPAYASGAIDCPFSPVLRSGTQAALELEERLSLFRLLVLAGQETSAAAIGNAAALLFRFPGELAKVRGDPNLVPVLVEESLRYESPVQVVRRGSIGGAVISGVELPADAEVVVILGAANRDPRQFPDPDRFNVTRQPRQHLAFGSGPHYCVGARLARLESSAALAALIPVMSNLRPRFDPDAIRMANRGAFRGVERLDVVC